LEAAVTDDLPLDGASRGDLEMNLAAGHRLAIEFNGAAHGKLRLLGGASYQ